MSVKYLIQFRRDTAANWTSVNPSLAVGEIGYETDTGKHKVGRALVGTTPATWTELPYSTLLPTGGTSGQILVKQNSTDYNAAWTSAIPEFLQVVNIGTVGTNYSFTLNKKFICQFQFSSSGYSAANTLRTWNLIIGSTTVAQSKHYFNPASTHMACPVGVGTITLDAGTYNARVTTDASTDVNDFATIWATLIPTV